VNLGTIMREGAPVIVQGLTGRQGRRHAGLMRAFGTNVVGGVSPNVDRESVDGLPVFPDCAAAVAATGAVASVVMVRPESTAEAVIEAVSAGIDVIVSVAEGMRTLDSLRALREVRRAGAVWIGPSTPGMAIPGNRLKLGFLPNASLLPGPVGIMSRSGTLSYEVGYRLAARGIGQSVWIGVGGDPVKGTRFAELAPFFHQDDATRALIVIGEIGGNEEEEFAATIEADGFGKPVFAIVAGGGAPEGVTMGHAGALVHGPHGAVETKRMAFEAAGVTVCPTIEALVDTVEASI
jgi:succinyl-CoA synthetase alpha subunit